MRPFSVQADDGTTLHGECSTTVCDRAPSSDSQRTGVILLHGGGDRASLRPLAVRLAAREAGHRIVLPDVRGYGESTCRDPDRHTWARYVEDVAQIAAALGLPRVVLVGAGLGATIALRTAVEVPSLVAAVAVVSPEDIEDDAGKGAETALMDLFARTVHEQGLRVAWDLYLPDLQPLIGSIVRESLTRADPASAAAAASIGHDRAFARVDDLAVIDRPVLVVPGDDQRHPAALATCTAAVLPRGRLASARIGSHLRTAEDLAEEVAPEIIDLIEQATAS